MHLLLRSKHIAPNPHIARAPELVIQNTTINSSLYQEVVDVSSFISSTVRSTDSRTVPDLFVCKSRRLIVILLIFLSVSSVCLSRRHVILYRKTYALLRTMVQGRRREACFSDFSLDFV